MAGSTKQYIGIVDMLCEGPIQGLVDGKASVYVNDIPFERSSVVGTMNETQNGTFGAPLLSFNPAGSNTTTVTTTNTTLTQNDVGKFVHIVVEAFQNITLQVLSFSNSLVGTYNYSYITGTGVDSDFETVGDPSSYLRLVRPGGGEFVAQGIWDSANSRLNLYGGVTLFANQWTTRSDWTVQRIKAFKIVSVAADGASFVVDSSLGSSALTDVKFFIEELRTVDTSTNVNINDTVSKFDGSTVQFRRGTIDQAPIEQTNSLSGGTTITGTGNGVALKQSNDSSSPITTNYGFTSYSTDGYPEGQSFEESATAALEIPGFSSSSTGPRFGLTASQVKQVDEINIRINYPALLTHNNENGDKESASAIYVFQIATTGVGESTYGSWQTLFSKNGGRVTHTDKSTAPVSFDHTIGLDRFKPFDNFKIRIIRLTRDVGLPVRVDGGTGGETDKDKFMLQAASQISGADLSATIKDKLTYPFTAHAAISFSSKTYNSLPARSYLLQGLKVRIPTAYTPREYTSNGVAQYDSWWNGDFKKDPDGNYLLYYTDNPAWVFYDIVTNNRYGAGEWIDRNFINEYSLYRISKYCDELVDDGKGGTEPRFRANLYLSKSTDVYKVLKDMATIFTGMLYWLDGKITPVQDVPSEPIYTFTKGNVIEGVFNYESTGRKTRANQVVVTWNDPAANYEPVPLIVEDRENIVKTKKIISQNAVAMGATSEGQAYRYGRWKLWTAQNQKEIVTFETGLQGAYIRPGDVINVQDRDRYGVDFSGLTSSTTAATTSDVTLDRKLTNASNAALYKLTTLVTNYAAFYTGLNAVTIDNVTYNRGDRITGNVYLYDDDTNSLQLGTITTERDASNAFLNASGTPLPTEWKEYTHVITKAVSLDNSGDVSVATVDTTTTNSNVRDSEKTAYTTSGSNPTAPGLGTVWALQAIDTDGVNILGSKKEYKVLSLAQNDSKNTYTISAVEHYNIKYDAVDKDYNLGVIPSNVFPIIENPDEEVPAPQNIYIAIDSDSSKPGEELTVNWLTPQETFTDTDDNTQTRDYSFIDKYELYHNVPHIDSPIITDRLSYRFDNLEDGLYTFRVRTVSRKQNYSDFVSTQYDVNDQYGTNVERVVGGLPKGIYANSQIEYSYNADDNTSPEAVRFIEDSASGFSKAHALTDTFSASSLYDVSVAGLGSSELRREQEWYFLLLDGGASKVYWDTDSLANLPFYRKISGSQWRGSVQTWGSIGSVSVDADSTKLTGSGFNSNLKPRDIITFENTSSVKAAAINSVSTSGSTYQLTIASADGTPASHLISTGDKIKVENATFTGSGTDLNGKEYYVAVSGQNVQLYTDEARTEAVTIGKTWSEGGFFRRVDIPAAKVIAVVSDTQAILDRSFSTSYSTTGYRHTYRPDYKDDAVFGRVRWDSYDEQTELNSYRVESFITLEPNLRAGKAVVVTPSLETIRYETEADGTTTQSTSFTSLTATVSAVGFSNPEFRLVSFTFPGDIDVDSTVLDQTISSTFVAPDDVGGFEKEFTINSDSSVAYSSTINNVDYAGTPILIKAEVREKNNVGINAFGTGDIIRIKDGAAGTQGRTVELTAEDYTIVYDEDGANPSFEGTDSNITLTTTSRNFAANPLFRITVDSNYAPSTTFSNWVDGTSGTDNSIYSTYITPPTSVPSYTSKLIEVQVAERPDNWSSSTQQGEDSDGNAIVPVAGAIDSISILYLQKGEGGIAIANSNSAHSYTTDADGEFTTSTIPNSGTTLEVLIGGKRASYVGSTGVSSGAPQGTTLGAGEWYVVSAVPSTSEFSAGNITESNDIVTIAPVNVNNSIGYGEESETITWTIRVGTRSGSAVDLTTIQSLTKSIKGEAGEAAKALSISPNHQFFIRQKDNTYSPAAIKFTANKQNITGTPAWTGPNFYDAASGGNSIAQSGQANEVWIRASDLTSSTDSVTVTASLVANSVTYSDSESVEVLDEASDAITVSLSNDNHTFTASNTGTVSNFAGSGTTIRVFEGGTQLSYDGENDPDNGTFNVGTPTQSATNGVTLDDTPTAADNYVFGNVTAFAAADNITVVTYPITGKTIKGESFTTSATQTYSKAKQGAGGANAKVVQLTAADYSVVYNQDGGSPDPATSIALTATAKNFTSAVFKFTGDGVTDDTSYNNTTGTDTFTVPSTYFSTPKTIRVGAAESADATNEVAFDSITITGIKPGIDAEKNANLGLVYTTSNISLDSTLEKISKTANDNSWNGQVYSTGAYTGGAKVEFSPNQTNKRFMMGLNTDPATDANHTSIDYHWYCLSNGTLRARINGYNAAGTPTPTYAAGDILSVVYDNDTITWLQNGTVQHQVTASRNLKFHLDSSFYDTGTDITRFFDFAPAGASALSYTVVCTNESHAFSANNSGVVSDYTGSGTTFEAYRGATRLQGINSGTPTRGQFKVTAGTAVNITKSSTNGTVSGTDIVFSNHSGFTNSASTASIPYSISLENEVTISKTQTFSKSKQGTEGTSVTGPEGDDAARTHSGYLYWTSTGVPTNANRPSATQTYDFDDVGTDAAFSTLGNWSVQAPTIGNDPDSSIDRETIYYITYSVIETVDNGVAQGTASSITFGSVTQGFNFTGLVTFTNLETSGQTTIDGTNITTGSIKSSDYTDDTGSLFASQGVKLDLDNDVIETPYFYTTPTGAGFKGSITLASNTDFSINGNNLATVAFNGLYSSLSGTPNLSTVATSGSYSDLSGAPTIPTDLDDLTDNTSLLFDGNYNNLSNLPTLFDGQYSSLTGLPTLFDGNYSSLSGTPTIPSDINDLSDASSLLFSGSYSDLTNRPTIPSALSDLNNDIGAITGVASGSNSYASVSAGSLTINPTNIVGATTAVTAINSGSTTYASVSNNKLTIVPSAIVLATDAVTSVVDGDSGTGFIALSNNQLTLTPSAINITSLAGVGDLATQDEADLDYISSSTSISAGKIVLSSGSLDFTTNTATANNTIVLDTTSNANRIVIYSGTTARVVIGKL